MKITLAAVCLLLAGVACSNNAKPAHNSSGASFTLTGSVQAVQPGDKPPATPKGVTGIAGSFTFKADQPLTGCDNPTKVFFTQSTTGSSGTTTALVGKHVDVHGTQYANCVLVAGSIAAALPVTSGSSGGSGSSGASSSPGTVVPSASPKVTKGPGPEGAIYDQTPSVPPATQK